ncbi:putative Troponin T [Hypsibius exemplaris]|uniref:Troponin T n=1 Tax=Hypsibius exemplaris TaxID=2072580 RepID=A0A1W0WVP5_HYPEX|nr:putative Troponin T [Hypsibius exemplaris]
MSDEEGGWGNERHEEEKGEEKTEAQKMIEAKQKKHEEEESARLRDLEEQRRLEREKEEEELRRLKEKQAQRKKEREEEEAKQEEMKRQAEEQRREQEEARRLEKEAEKAKRQEEAERKKAAAMASVVGGRNFVIEKKGENSTMDKFMNISKAKTEMSLNTNELEALKVRTINDRVQPLSLSGLGANELKQKAEQLWKQIVQLETDKYDLSERSKRQEYDLKELNERQRQINRQKYIAQGVDPEANARYPPKVQIISKYERRTDRRTFGDRKVLFDGSKVEEQKEILKPKGVLRDEKAWIKKKEEDRKRGSHDAVEEEDAPAPARPVSSGGGFGNDEEEPEEVAVEEEEE